LRFGAATVVAGLAGLLPARLFPPAAVALAAAAFAVAFETGGGAILPTKPRGAAQGASARDGGSSFRFFAAASGEPSGQKCEQDVEVAVEYHVEQVEYHGWQL
jgi:hypothetical protein